jgi:hypothetical protein
LLAIGYRYGRRKSPGKQVISGVTGTHFDLIAFPAEAFDGFEQEDFTVCHNFLFLKFYR